MVWRSGAGDYMSFQSGARMDSGGGRRGAASFGFWPRESRGDSRDTRDTGGYLSFCMGPKESVAKAVQQPNLGLCGIQGHSGRDQEHEFKVLRLPRCGHCTAPDNGVENFETELSFPSSDKGVGTTVAQRNVQTAKSVICEVYRDLERRCHEERRQYEESGTQPSQQKLNFWSTYTNKARLQHFTSESVAFVQKNPECRSRLLTGKQLRFLVLLQHLVSEDSLDVTRPERLRKHQDVFEGVLTDSISSQLVEDAHRCEFSIEGRSFSLQDVLQLEGQQEERKKRIAQFQSELVHALETYLLSFCARKGLSPGGSKRLMQAVTTQMSQAGLANIDRGSEASRYFVGSQGLDQRIAYNLSTMYVHDQEALKLSIVCMRTGFTQYLDKDELLHLAGVQYPRRCKPDSYLYQYATLCFTIGPPVENSESIECSVLDALDEAQINAALGEDEEEVILDEAQLQVT